VWCVVLAVVLYRLGGAGERFPSAVTWGFLIPFLVWNQLMGLTAFLQHTHPRLPWFRSKDEARASKTQAEVTMVIRYPTWYDVLSHNIMQHQAHHINPRIPWYRLKAAQRKLQGLLGESAVVERMSLKYVFSLTQACQLYDYDRNRWLTFAGRPTFDAALGRDAIAPFQAQI
jgi:omega-6 fatty acid desaturase (delta-12 desaturase)